MKALSKGGLLLAVSLVASLAIAAGAQAQTTIEPAATAVSGTAANPTLTYGTATVKCNTGTASGTTKSPKATNIDLTVAFSGNCNINGLAATVTCSGTVNLVADEAKFGVTSGTINLNSGFTCTINVSGVCQVDVEGPQTTGSVGTLSEGATTLTATVAVSATRTGSSLCGPASGPGSFTASYNVTPANLTVTSP
jgi:hypothetical protein